MAIVASLAESREVQQIGSLRIVVINMRHCEDDLTAGFRVRLVVLGPHHSQRFSCPIKPHKSAAGLPVLRVPCCHLLPNGHLSLHVVSAHPSSSPQLRQ